MPVYKFPFYAAVDKRFFPRSYVGKFLLVAFISTHLPLVCVALAAALAPGSLSLGGILLLLLLATIGGTAIAFFCFSQLLSPVQALGQALRTYLHRNQVPRFPDNFQDEIGLTLRNTQYVLRQLQERERELNDAARRDHLTGLFNRRAAEEALNELLQDPQSKTNLVVALADVDHFKHINDRYGHLRGDMALQQVANFLRERMRAGDWVARWGGEEFLVVMRAPLEGAHAAMDRLREELAHTPLLCRGHPIKLSLSIGLSETGGARRLAPVIEAADRALYRAKAEGRDRVVACAEA